MTQSFTLGIDLGTTNSVAAVWYQDEPLVLPIQNVPPRELLPSVVFIESPDRVYVGMDARNRRGQRPDRFISSVKSAMGTDTLYPIGDRTYTPEDISSFILKEIITRAQTALKAICKDDVVFRNLVVTVPARFTPNARRATETAISHAGYPPGPPSMPGTHTLLLESDAAALTYIRDNPTRQRVVVYDLGGGTFDVTAMQFNGDGGAGEPFTLLGAPGGNPHLGGDLFDERVFERMVEHFNTGGDPTPRQRSYPEYFDFTQPTPNPAIAVQWQRTQQDLRARARECKEAVCSYADEATPYRVELPELLGRIQPVSFSLTRREFETLIADLIDATATEVRRLLAEYHLHPDDIDRVVLAGGSTRIPAIRTRLKAIFGIEPYATLEPDKAIAIGAALYDQLRALDGVAPVTLLTVPIGVKVTKRLSQAVIGANGDLPDERNAFCPVLSRGLTCPGTGSLVVTTTHNNQSVMRFEVYQQDGELGDALCQPRDLMGWFTLDLPPAAARLPKGFPRVSLTFALNPNATAVDVSAVEQTTGASVAVTFSIATGGATPPPDDIGVGAADVVIAIDTTASMAPSIAAMRDEVNAFADRLAASGIDFRIALIDYRDLEYNEPMTLYDFTSDADTVRRCLAAMDARGGHDLPESTLDAIECALSQCAYRPEVKKNVIVITDAPSHVPSRSGASMADVAARLRAEDVSLFIVSPAANRRHYAPLINEEQGGFHEMGRHFPEIIRSIAARIADITII